MSPLLSLPYEVRVEIFSYLSPCDIAACRRSCRLLNDTVTDSLLLRYLLRIGRLGLYDPLLPGYTTSQRTEALEKCEATWSDLYIGGSHHAEHVFTCQFTRSRSFDPACQVHNGFLIGINSFDKPEYAYVDLRTFQPGGVKDSWTKITNESWRGNDCHFVFSVEQDLVLAILSPRHQSPMFIELQGIRFSLGTPHPLVVNAVIPIERKFHFMEAIIVGDFTILNLSGLAQRMLLHSWKDGQVFSLRESSKQDWSFRFIALSRDTVVLVNTVSAALEICRIVDGPDTPSLRTIVQLGLPPLAPDARVLFYSHCTRESVPTYSDVPSLVIEGRTPRRPPFHESPDKGIVVFVIVAQINSGPRMLFTIVTHLRSLMALAASTSSEVAFIPWESWGPRATACFGLRFRPKLDVIVGDRLAILSREALSIFDFNSTRIQDAINKNGDSSGRSVDATMVEHISVIPKGRLFKEDVVGELPYISVVRPVSTDWQSLVNYEEGLAGLSWDSDDTYISNVKIHTAE